MAWTDACLAQLAINAVLRGFWYQSPAMQANIKIKMEKPSVVIVSKVTSVLKVQFIHLHAKTESITRIQVHYQMKNA